MRDHPTRVPYERVIVGLSCTGQEGSSEMETVVLKTLNDAIV